MKKEVLNRKTRFIYTLTPDEAAEYDKAKANYSKDADTVLKRLMEFDPSLKYVIKEWDFGIDPTECFMPFDYRVVDLDDGSIRIEIAFQAQMVARDYRAAKAKMSKEQLEEMKKTVLKGMDKFKLADLGLMGCIVLGYKESTDVLRIGEKIRIPLVSFQNGEYTCLLAEGMYNYGYVDKMLDKIEEWYTDVYFMPHNIVEQCRLAGLNIDKIDKLPAQ